MPKPNYAFEKRQRDLAKKQKKEEKQKRKTETTDPGDTAEQAVEAPPTDGDQTAAAADDRRS